jgi:hypothetical protein
VTHRDGPGNTFFMKSSASRLRNTPAGAAHPMRSFSFPPSLNPLARRSRKPIRLSRHFPTCSNKPYRWESWAAPKDKSGKLDHNNALTGDDLLDFANRQLLPYL